MRGKHTPVAQNVSGRRNIPAYAGKTRRRRRIPVHPAEHPRVCGENYMNFVIVVEPYGTSPRMRGKHSTALAALSSDRNIPAYAGKTATDHSQGPPRQEHPRVCGENRRQTHRCHKCNGTSPRMRGKHGNMTHLREYPRNIPAYAGKTASPRCCP